TIGYPEMAHDPAYATLSQRAPVVHELNERVAPWIASHTFDEVMEALVEAGVPVAPVYSASDIATDPHYEARGSLVTVDAPVAGRHRQPAPTPRLSRTPGQIYRHAPSLGEHNEEVYGGWL